MLGKRRLPAMLAALLVVTLWGSAAWSDNAGQKLTFKQTLGLVRDEFQLYRGRTLERVSNWCRMGRSRFDPGRSVADNLRAGVERYNRGRPASEQLKAGLESIGGRQVYVVQVELARGKRTKQALRSLYRHVFKGTIEFNYKAASARSPFGHVATRVGNGATYDLTGGDAAAQLPRFLAGMVRRVTGRTDLSFGRQRNLRRFMEGRRDWSHKSSSVYYGLLFKATPAEIRETEVLYRGRLGLRGGKVPGQGAPQPMKRFALNGGDSAQGVYSCAQVLSEKVPFFNTRGIDGTISAQRMVQSAVRSPAVEAVIVYKMPSVGQEQLQQSNPW